MGRAAAPSRALDQPLGVVRPCCAEALIQLLDVNDNDPVVKFRYFPATSRYASVDENAQVGTVVLLGFPQDKSRAQRDLLGALTIYICRVKTAPSPVFVERDGIWCGTEEGVGVYEPLL